MTQRDEPVNTPARHRSSPPQPYWLIVGGDAYREGGSPEIFSLDLLEGNPGEGKLLPVFGSERSAEGFLHHALGRDEGCWHVRPVGAGEMTRCSPAALLPSR